MDETPAKLATGRSKERDRSVRDRSVRDRSVRVWDVPTRVFHWLLVGLVAFSLYTGLVGGFREMGWHVKSGYAILALVLFRIVWGVIGSRHSRFTDFVRGPFAVFAYARDLLRNASTGTIGHNPLGGWSVMAMLASLLVQAGTGLFSNDDILTEGPLASLVSKSVSDQITAVHDANAVILMVLIGVHLSAIAFYALVKRENLVRAMITGRKPATPDAPDAPYAPVWLAAAVLVAAVLAVSLIVA
jgi:cytochrome b